MRIIRAGSRIQDLRKGKKIGARCAKDSRTATMRHPVPLLIILAPMPAVDGMFSELIHNKQLLNALILNRRSAGGGAADQGMRGCC
jgi:hypothetical protein